MKRLITLLLLFAATFNAVARHYDLTAQRLSTADGLPTNVVIRIWQDAEGYMWFDTRGGLCRYDGYVLQVMDEADVAKPEQTKELTTREATWQREGQGRLARVGNDGTRQSWQLIPPDIISYTRSDHFHVCDVDERMEAVSTYGSGLYLYDKPTGELTQLTKESTRGLLDDDYLTGLFVDRTGCIWVIEDYLGVKCLRMNHLQYRPLWLQENAKIQDANYIRCIAPMGGDELLVSNQMGKVYTLYIEDGIWKIEDSTTRSQSSTFNVQFSMFNGYRVYSALLDSQGRRWTGTRGNGLWCNGQRIESLPSPHIFNIREGSDGSIIVSMLEGGVALLPQKREDKRSNMRRGTRRLLLPGKNVHDAQTDRQGRLWVAAEEGLYLLDKQLQTVDSLSGCFVCLHLDSQGAVWAGSTDAGLVRANGADDHILPTYFKKENGLATSGVLSIVEDKAGCLWLGTEEGLTQLNPATGDIVNQRIAESPLSNVFCERAAVCLSDGRLLFGSHNGMVEVTPTQAGVPVPPSTAITGLLVNGEHHTTDSILTYRQNNLTFQFSNFQYARRQSVLYQFRLDGVDQDWCKPTAEPTAVYRRLLPGCYTFRVRSTAGGGVWGDETALSLTIRQPWWNTWWAWLLYVLTAATILAIVFVVTRRIMRLHRRLEVEQRVAAFKQDFYDRIQRELRNPATVLQGAAENVQLSGTSKTTVQSLRRGSRRMLRLMDMIRQFNQIDHVEMQVRAEQDKLNSDAEARFREIADSIHAEEDEFKELAPPPINDQTILIVEEDEDTLEHLTDMLNPYFRITGCTDTTDAMKIIDEQVPSLLLIDITTNEEVGRNQTKAILSAHTVLPIIHLSAYDDDAHQLRSLRSGAVDYIVKPFSGKVLLERITKILERTKDRTAQNSNEQLSSETIQFPELLTSLKDKKFLDQFHSILSARISDENFSVEQFAELMNLGRTQFYKRVKTLTGETPVQHLHRARLDYAARLLKAEPAATIEEVMNRAGFHSATHFYNAFKKQFGLSPKDYRKTD